MHIRKNLRENLVMAEMLSQGWEVITKGCPDLICFKDGTIHFIEVKPKKHEFGTKDGLSAHQKKFISWLRKSGISVEVRYVD